MLGFVCRLELLNKVMTFFSDWSVDSCEEDVVTFTFRGSSNKQQKATQNKHQQKLAKELVYKLHVKIDMKSLAVENVQVDMFFLIIYNWWFQFLTETIVCMVSGLNPSMKFRLLMTY